MTAIQSARPGVGAEAEDFGSFSNENRGMVALSMPDFADDTAPAAWALDLRESGVPALVQVRRWAAKTLSALDDAHLGDVMLVVTELVTNAYDHGDGPRRVRVSHTPTPCQVLIEVDDSCPAHPVLVRPKDTEPHGRGMLIVDKLAADWGVDDNPASGGKTVWARISCDDTEPERAKGRYGA